MADLSRYAPSRAVSLSSNLILRPLPKDLRDLSSAGYYEGYPCPFGHTIRDSQRHWCYHCALKVRSNNCGLDVNFIDSRYRNRLTLVWNEIDIRGLEDCWYLKTMDPTWTVLPRITYPSYRSLKAKQVTDRVPYPRIIYSSTWGDAGSLRVTHRCNDPCCLNPLHLVTSLNCLVPPRAFTYFELDYQPNKLLLLTRHLNSGGKLEDFHQLYFKHCITDPTFGDISTKLNDKIEYEKAESLSDLE